MILFFIWWRFQHLIKIMADVAYILNDDFGHVVIHQRKALGSIKTRMFKECHRQGQGAFIRA